MLKREALSIDTFLGARQGESAIVDRAVLGGVTLDSLSFTAVEEYRRDFAERNPGHAWATLNDLDFLVRIGAVIDVAEDAPLSVTSAGLLMFGLEHEVRKFFPNYLLDCRCGVEGGEWESRIITNDGQSAGSLYGFYRESDARISSAIDDMRDLKSDVRKELKAAAREGLVNALVHADYDGRRHVVIEQSADRIVFANPGRLLVDRITAERGGVSDTRNPALMKMFFLVGATRDAGTGVPLMFEASRKARLSEPILSSDRSGDRTELTLLLRSDRRPAVPEEPEDVVLSTQPTWEIEGVETRAPSPRLSEDASRISYAAQPFQPYGTDANEPEGSRAAVPRRHLDEEASAHVADLVDGLDSESADVVRLIAAKRRIKRSEVQEELGVGSTKAKQLLASLVIQGIVRTEGNGRGTNYVLS